MANLSHCELNTVAQVTLFGPCSSPPAALSSSWAQRFSWELLPQQSRCGLLQPSETSLCWDTPTVSTLAETMSAMQVCPCSPSVLTKTGKCPTERLGCYPSAGLSEEPSCLDLACHCCASHEGPPWLTFLLSLMCASSFFTPVLTKTSQEQGTVLGTSELHCNLIDLLTTLWRSTHREVAPSSLQEPSNKYLYGLILHGLI